MSLYALLTVDNAQSHVTAFRPISEAARSWSDDNLHFQSGGGSKTGILQADLAVTLTTNLNFCLLGPLLQRRIMLVLYCINSRTNAVYSDISDVNNTTCLLIIQGTIGPTQQLSQPLQSTMFSSM